MSLQVELKKSAVSQKLPLPSDLALGEIALNYNADGPFLTCKDTAGNIRKLNRVWIATTAPSNPTAGDPWLDTSGSAALLRIYDGSTWTVAVNVPLATTSVYGTVQLATSADITNGTAGKIVDAAQLSSKVSGDISTALSASPLFLNSINLSGNATVNGNLVVNGTTTTIDSTNLSVTDRNIEIGVVDTPSDITANTGGITLKGTTDKTIQWLDATDSWTFSEHVDLASGKTYKINGIDVLTATALGSGVTDSSLTSVGTIGTGVWQGTAIVDTYLATISTAGKVSNSATTATDANTPSTIVARDGSGDFSAGTITAALAGNADTATAATTATKLSSTRTFALTGDVTGTVNSDLTSGASIAASISGLPVSKLQDGAARQLLQTDAAGTGVEWTSDIVLPGAASATSFSPTGSSVPADGLYLPAANSVALSTNGTGRLFVDASGNVGVGTSSPSSELTVAGTIRSEQSGNRIGINHDGTNGNISTNAGNFLVYANGANNIICHTNGTERARIDSSGRLLVGTSSDSGGALLQVNGDRVRIATAKTPASASDTGTAGEICWDASYIYVCTATNTWKRAALFTW